MNMFKPLPFWGAFVAMVSITLIASFVLPSSEAFRIFAVVLSAACLTAALFLRRLEREYGRDSLMWWAWRLMLLSCLVEAIRHAVDFTSTFYHGPVAARLRGLALLPVSLSLTLELAALALLWLSFYRVGIHTPFSRKDWLLILVIGALLVSCFSERDYFPHATSALRLFRHIELANPILFAVSIVIAVVLYRLSRDLGDGDLALSILFLALQLSARFLGFELETLRYRFHEPALAHPSNACYWSSVWLVVWAILLRWRVTQKAHAAILVYRDLDSHTTV